MYTLIDTQAGLDQLTTALESVTAGSGCIALDTEFLREKTYSAKLCLMQLAMGDQLYCIDVLNIKDFSVLKGVLENPQVYKLFHAARQDMEVILQTLGVLPKPIFDTQLAAAFCGSDMQIGYAGMVKQWLGVELTKSQARTDWSQRPLSDAQLSYASEDVAYLHQMRDLARTELEGQGKTDWFNAELEHYYRLEQYQTAPELAYQRLHAGELPIKQQYLLKAIAQWREEQAQKRDIPRTWVLKDPEVYQLARSEAQTEQAIVELNVFGRKSAHRQAKSVARIMSECEVGEQAIWQSVKAFDKKDKQYCAKMMKVVSDTAKQLNIAQGLLATRRDIEGLYRTGQSEKLLDTWRKEVVGDQLVGDLRVK